MIDSFDQWTGNPASKDCRSQLHKVREVILHFPTKAMLDMSEGRVAGMAHFPDRHSPKRLMKPGIALMPPKTPVSDGISLALKWTHHNLDYAAQR